jgi:hypothetical protein
MVLVQALRLPVVSPVVRPAVLARPYPAQANSVQQVQSADLLAWEQSGSRPTGLRRYITTEKDALI